MAGATSGARQRATAPDAGLFGRDQEVATVLRLLLGGQARLVTLTGAGGIGKTRIARACADAVDGDGAWTVRFVSLSAVGPRELLDEIGRAVAGPGLGARDGMGRVAAAIGDERWLLVLDTFEHLVGERAVVETLLERCPGLAVLVTSRVRLRSPGERQVAVGPLPTDPDGPAVALFEDRVRAGRAEVPDRAGCAAICAALDGSPLAIELAAARTAVLPAEAILRWLSPGSDRPLLELLGRGGAGLSERHRSVRSVAMWSYELLGSDARLLLQHLGAFAGPMTLEAVEDVSAGALDGGALDALSDLVEMHLVEAAPSPDGEPWFRLLDPLREFALERVADAGREGDVRSRHAAFYAALAGRAAEGAEGPDEQRWRGRVDAERANLIAALGWLRDQGEHDRALRMAVDLGPYWLHQGPISQGIEILAQLLAGASGDPALEAFARAWWCRLRAEDGDPSTSAALADARARLADAGEPRMRRQADEHLAHVLLLDGAPAQAGEVAEEMRASAARDGDAYGEASALVLLARADQQRGLGEPAVRHARRALSIADRIGHRRLVARAEQALAELGAFDGTAVRTLKATLSAYEAVGDRRGVVLACVNLGGAVQDAGDLPGAAAWYQRALRESRAIGYRHGEAFGVAGIVALAVAAGRPADAVALDAALAVGAPAASRIVPPAMWADYVELVDRARAALGPEAARAAAAGSPVWSKALERAEALAAEIAAMPPPGDVEPLTPREQEVLEHLAAGATNRQIAEQLHLSPKTVMHHTSNIFRKLGVRGRAEAVDAGHRLGLLS